MWSKERTRRACGPSPAVLLAVVLLGQAGCKDDQSVAPGAMPVPTKARPTGFEDIDTGKRPPGDEQDAKAKRKARLNGKTKGFSESELASIRAALPTFDDALVLDDLTTVRNARVATLTLCLASPLTKASSQIVARYREAKWNDVNVTSPNTQKSSRRLSANSKSYRMTATLTGGSTIGCPKPETHTKASFRFLERQPAVDKPLVKPMRDTLLLEHTTQEHPILKQTTRSKASNVGARAVGRPAPDSESPPPNPQD